MLALWLMLMGVGDVLAADVTHYFTSSANQRPRSNAGLSVSGDKIRINADLAMRAPGNQTQIVPNLSSAFTITDRVGLEARIDLAEWNSHADPFDARIDTRLHVRSPAPFLDELEGRVWRSPDGQSGRILKFGFYQTLRETEFGTPITLTSRAVVEDVIGTLQPVDPGISDLKVELYRPESRRLRLETELRGLMSSWLPGKTSLLLKVEESAGASSSMARSLIYDHSFSLRQYGNLGFNLGMVHSIWATSEAFEPSIGFSWRGDF